MRISYFALVLLTLAACAPRESAPPPSTATRPPAATATAEEPVVQCTPQGDRLCPVDEASKDPSFVAYRNDLFDAVRRKDELKFFSLLDENIRTTFGGDGGASDLRARWNTQSADSPIWGILEETLELGGSFRGSREDRMFWAPWVYANWPEKVDAFSNVAAIRAGVPLREKAAADAKQVLVLDWSILEVIPSRGPSGWTHVRTITGTEGWVDAADVRSPIGYRAGFSKKSGVWKMTAFVAGD